MNSFTAANRLVGLSLVVLGIWFLLPLVSGFEFPIGQWWPILLSVVGLGTFASGNRRAGILVVGASVLLLLSTLGAFPLGALWPLALIACGAAIALRRLPFGSGKAPQAGDGLRVSCLFASGNRRVDSQQFQGGVVSVAFGTAAIDLSDTALDGDATVDISALFGSVVLRVPPDWSVDVRTFSAFGDIEVHRATPLAPRGTLTLTGSCLFGEVRVTP